MRLSSQRVALGFRDRLLRRCPLILRPLLFLPAPQIIAQCLAEPLFARRPFGALCRAQIGARLHAAMQQKSGRPVKERLSIVLDANFRMLRQNHPNRSFGRVLGLMIGMHAPPRRDPRAVAFDR
jgi:hypothetical protein